MRAAQVFKGQLWSAKVPGGLQRSAEIFKGQLGSAELF